MCCKYRKLIYVIVPLLSLTALIGTIGCVISHSDSLTPGILKVNKKDLLVLVGIWTIIPPVWFFVEYFYIYKRCEPHDTHKFDQFKHGQQLAAAIWAGLLAFLFIAYKLLIE